MALAGSLAAHAEGVGRSQFEEIARASIEIENSGPSLTHELPADAGSPGDAGSPAAEARPSGNPLWAIPISKLSATRDRPLFSVSRRPPPPTVAAAPAPPPPAAKPVAPESPPPFTLVGTIIGENSRIAILLDENSKTSTGVREGDTASGWILRSVETHSVILDGSGRTVTLDLPEPTATAQDDDAPPRVAEAPKPRKGKFRPGNPDTPDSPDNPDNPDNP
jgi:general secretion pathway protein N